MARRESMRVLSLRSALLAALLVVASAGAAAANVVRVIFDDGSQLIVAVCITDGQVVVC